MSVTNLTRYSVFKNEHCDWNCGLMPQHDGPLIKFEEAMEASSNSLRHLKAEIAALELRLRTVGCISVEDTEELCSVREKMRQLSAV